MALTAPEEILVRELIAQQNELLVLAENEPVILSKLGAQKVSLSMLPVATVLDGADLVLLRQGTTDKVVTLATLKTFMNA